MRSIQLPIGHLLLGSLNQPIEQTGVERSVSDALGGPKV
jgi:hypothetical protein